MSFPIHRSWDYKNFELPSINRLEDCKSPGHITENHSEAKKFLDKFPKTDLGQGFSRIFRKSFNNMVRWTRSDAIQSIFIPPPLLRQKMDDGFPSKLSRLSDFVPKFENPPYIFLGGGWKRRETCARIFMTLSLALRVNFEAWRNFGISPKVVNFEIKLRSMKHLQALAQGARRLI